MPTEPQCEATVPIAGRCCLPKGHTGNHQTESRTFWPQASEFKAFLESKSK